MRTLIDALLIIGQIGELSLLVAEAVKDICRLLLWLHTRAILGKRCSGSRI